MGVFSILEYPIRGKIKPKVLGREFEGDSPQCGEMSHSDRGDRLRQRNPFSKGFPSIIKCNIQNKPLNRKRRDFYFSAYKLSTFDNNINGGVIREEKYIFR